MGEEARIFYRIVRRTGRRLVLLRCRGRFRRLDRREESD
jgi:hypothetical protein